MDFTRLAINRRTALLTSAAIAANVINPLRAFAQEAPRKGGVSYMLSSENWVHNGQKVVKYFPHLMFYAPYATNADIGSDGKDPNAPWVLNPGTPHAYIIVVSR